MSLTKPIPEKLKQRMDADPYYHRCCVTGTPDYREKVDWHHHFETYLHGNRGRLNEAWCILPLVWWVHAKAEQPQVKMYLDWIMLNRATDEQLRHWSVQDELITKRHNLNILYENKENHPVLHPDQGRSIPSIDF